jgi:hypothetical protein
MALLRILRRLCETHGISLGLRYIPSVLNIWADKLSRHRDSTDWALTPAAIQQIHATSTGTIQTHVYARRETVIPGAIRFHSTTGTGPHDPAGLPLPALDGHTPWPKHLGLTLVTPNPSHIGLVIRHLTRAPSDAIVIVPDWPAQPWF